MSGAAAPPRRLRAAGPLRRQSVETRRTRATRSSCAASAAAEDYDVVVAFGGDGTVNEAANGLAGSRHRADRLPGGSNNVSRSCSASPPTSSTPPSTCSRLADRWEPRAVDLGVVNGRYFTFAAGMGLDASVVERVDSQPGAEGALRPVLLRRVGGRDVPARYVVNPPRLTIEVDGAHGRAASACSSRTPSTTRTSRSRRSRWSRARGFDSGALAGVVLTRARPYDVPTVTVPRALGRGADRQARGHRGVRRLPGGGRALGDGRPIPVQVDGDHIGDELEARFAVAPGALRVVA